MVLYDFDSNAILSRPAKTKQASKMAATWTELHKHLRSNGYAPDLHILDNKCSHDLKKAFQKYNVAFQHVPPHVRRRNAAERAIQTWKNHFCAGLATCDPKLPLLEWDLLMPQAELTLNLLRASRRQPKLSAYACLNGPFDFNKTPLAPPGTRVIVHITPDQRSNMAPHGVDGWYVGPSPEHYRCHKCYIPSTHRARDALTVDWFPHYVPFPKVMNDEYLRQTATDMLTLLQDQAVNPIPSLTYGSPITNAYIQVAQILKRATSPPVPAPAPEQRVLSPIVAPPAPEQRVPTPAPRVPAPAQVPAPAPVPATSKKQPATPRPTICRHPPRPRRRHARYRPTTDSSAQSATSNRYSHHIAALATTPPSAGKQGSLTKLLSGPNARTWGRGTRPCQ
jgi:hypothetical protein